MLFAARDEEMLMAVYGCVGFFYLIVFLISIFFHVTLMKALQACAPDNQTMAPGLVWLRFVPLLHIVMPFINVVAVGNSLGKEYRDRGMRGSDESYGKTLGLTYYIIRYVTFFINLGGQILVAASRTQELSVLVGGLTLVLMLVQLILFIVYWVKISGFVTELNNSRGRSRYDDGYDDYGGGRRRGRYDDDDYDRDDDRGGRGDRDRGDRGYDDRDDRDRPRDDRDDDDYRRGDDRGDDPRPRDRY